MLKKDFLKNIPGWLVLVLWIAIPVLLFAQATVQPPPDAVPLRRDLTRGRLTMYNVQEATPDDGKGAQYPGYYGSTNHVIRNQTQLLIHSKDDAGNLWNQLLKWPGGWCVPPNTLVKNYNFRLSLDEPEEYTFGRTKSWDTNPNDDQYPMLYEIYTKRMVWSLPKYDDFVITKQVIKNIDTRAWIDCYIGYHMVVDPCEAGDRFKNDNEYVWASDCETFGDEKGVFIFYDDVSWPGFSTSPAVYSFPPGTETGDRGDPGNILEANSIDRKLYSPMAVAIGFLDCKPNKNGQKKFYYSIRNSEGVQPWSHQNAPASETKLWHTGGYDQYVEWMTTENPRMSWKEANAAKHSLAGSTWERSPFLTIGIGPYDIAPGDSVEYLMLWCAGEMDRNISQLGGLDATKLLPQAAIDSTKKNWKSAIELIKNNYKPKAYPPPTPGNAPKGNHGDELIVEVYSAPDETGKPSQGYIIKWVPVPDSYLDPIKLRNDFVKYRIYKSEIGIEGPWKLVKEIGKDESKTMLEGGRVVYRQESDPGVPSRFCVTTVDDDGLECGKTAFSYDALAAPRAPSDDMSLVRVVPSPFRQVSGLLDVGQEKRLEFVNIPAQCTIRIYTLAGELVQTVEHNGYGSAAWGSSTGDNNNYMLTRFAANVQPGVYLYHITSHVNGHEGETATGKFAIIK